MSRNQNDRRERRGSPRPTCGSIEDPAQGTDGQLEGVPVRDKVAGGNAGVSAYYYGSEDRCDAVAVFDGDNKSYDR